MGVGLREEAGLLDRGMGGRQGRSVVSTCYSQAPHTFP